VENSAEKALEAARKLDASVKAEDLHQDEDVLDTWFSSWLWPISVFDPQRPGQPDHQPNADLAYYYPTNDLVTGPDIIFFWVARMIMAGNEFMGDVPFHNVYFTGIVRDRLGRKMSKTLGNSPNPLDLIEKYGADAVRLGMLLCSSAGSDILYDESQIEQGRNFCNKIWNSYRLIKGWDCDASAAQPESAAIAVKWFTNKLSQTVELVNDHYSKFRISDALMTIYKLFWDDFCAWYLELVKPEFGKPVDKTTYEATVSFMDALLKLLHPIMPFITEELWQNISERKEGETIMVQKWPEAGEYDSEFIAAFELCTGAIASVRNIRQSKGISPKESLALQYKGAFPQGMTPVLVKMANLSAVDSVSAFENPDSGASFMAGTVEMFVPLAGLVNVEEEIAKMEAEIKHLEGFLKGVKAKLSNEKFVNHAPENVVALERKKECDATTKLENLTRAIANLKK